MPTGTHLLDRPIVDFPRRLSPMYHDMYTCVLVAASIFSLECRPEISRRIVDEITIVDSLSSSFLPRLIYCGPPEERSLALKSSDIGEGYALCHAAQAELIFTSERKNVIYLKVRVVLSSLPRTCSCTLVYTRKSSDTEDLQSQSRGRRKKKKKETHRQRGERGMRRMTRGLM